MVRHLMKTHRSRLPVCKLLTRLSPEMRAFVNDFRAKLDGMQVVDFDPPSNVIPFPSNVIPFRKR